MTPEQSFYEQRIHKIQNRWGNFVERVEDFVENRSIVFGFIL